MAQLPEPPRIEQGVSQADIDAYGERCYMAGYRAAFREMARLTLDYVTAVSDRARYVQRLRKLRRVGPGRLP